MSCQACTRSYGFFCKESGCPNCGFSFCTKCLKKEIKVPKYNGAKMKVCLKCFEKLEALQRSEELIPGVAPLSREIKTSGGSALFDLEDLSSADLGPVLEPIQNGDEALSDDDISKNLDSVISRRLKKLKEDENQSIPTDNELSSRLAQLKGVPDKEYNKSDLLLSKDTRTDKQKIDELLKQFADENDIDTSSASTDPITEIEKRLAALRGNEPKLNRKTENNTPSDDGNEDEAAMKIVNRFLEEAKLPDVPSLSDDEKYLIASVPTPSNLTEELPWCTICNEDAVIRCLGCDGDLFCRNCFKECHMDDEEYREHQTKPFEKPPVFKEDHF